LVQPPHPQMWLQCVKFSAKIMQGEMIFQS
jgi:hypothetical protein